MSDKDFKEMYMIGVSECYIPESQEKAKKTWENWLRLVKAEAWDEGYMTTDSNCAIPCGACDLCQSEAENPYRKGGTEWI